MKTFNEILREETDGLQEEKKKIDQKILAIRRREIERGGEIMGMCGFNHTNDKKSAEKNDPETGAPIFARTCPGFAHFVRKGQVVDSYACAACQKFR